MIDSDDLRKGKDPYCQKVPPQKNSYPEKKMGGLIVDAI